MPFKLGLKTISAALFLAFAVSDASAASLGRMTVLSTLEQPLLAEIEVTGLAPGEVTTMIARLASPADYRQAGLEVSETLQSMRFVVESKGGRSFIKISSPKVINEPLIDLLLELKSTNGRMIREYNFLLDPPSNGIALPLQAPGAPSTAVNATVPVAAMAPAAAASVALAAGVVAPAGVPPAAVKPAEIAVHNKTDVAFEQREVAAPPAGQGNVGESKPPSPEVNMNDGRAEVKAAARQATYRVKKGDSLGKIARQVKGPDVSRDQMLVALYNGNQAAFVNGNMNRLRAGTTLSVPAAEAALAVDRAEAHKIVISKMKNFADYRQRLAAQVAAGDSAKASAAVIEKPVREGPSKRDSNVDDGHKDTLKLSKPNRSRKSGLDVADEIAHEKALAESNGRVKQLEGYVKDLQKILTLQEKELNRKK